MKRRQKTPIFILVRFNRI